MTSTKQLHIKLDEDLKHKFKVKCTELGTNMQDRIKELVINDLKQEIEREEKPEFKFIDLFAGVGGLRIPFDELGGKCVLGSEIDKYAKTTYNAYFNHMPKGDIAQIKPCEIEEFDILVGGFPCQPFSMAGHRKGFTDTRGTLFFEIEKILRCKMPKAFLLENVKGLRGHDKGNTYKVIKESLESMGYFVDEAILAARDFGLPQNRERIYIVGFLEEEHFNKFNFPKTKSVKTKLGDILEKSVDDKYTISDRLWAGHQRRKLEHKKKGNGFGYGLFNEESEYTNTISARYYKDGSEILIEQKDKNPRKLTPLEAAKLQGFPTEIVEKAQKAGVSDTQLYKQFGNAVPVNVVREVAKNIYAAMYE
jgi:DNA (cytosine-5)-methyltransferase 1